MSAGWLLVGNPTAQSGKNAERIAKARELMDAAGLGHAFASTQPNGGTVEVVRQALVAADAPQTVVYMGGDGTFAEVAKGILEAHAGERVRLGMLPTGTANDQGRSFGLSSEEEELPRNVKVLAAGNEKRLDAGRIRAKDQAGAIVKEDWFFDSAGWGISPRVLELRNQDREAIGKIPIVRDLWRDQLVYAGALFRTFLASYVDDDKFDATVDLDHGREVRLYAGLTDLVVKATPIYGGAWVLAPEGKPDDGLFEVVPFEGKRDWISKALVHLEQTGTLASALEKVGVSHSPVSAGSHLEIELRPHDGGLPLAAQIDGEVFPASRHVVIDVLPQALRIIVP